MGINSLGRPPSLAKLQEMDPRLTWTEEMRNQIPSAKGGKNLPPPNFSGQQIGQALQQQELERQRLADLATQGARQTGGFGNLS